MRRLALLACLPTLAYAAPASPAAPGLPDTGQTTRFTRTFGEDADYLGRAPAYRDNRDGTVTDLVTGLIWQKVDGGEMTWERSEEHTSELQSH